MKRLLLCAALWSAASLFASATQDPQAEFDTRKFHAFEEIGPALRQFESAWPDLFSIGTIGTSREGRPLWLVTLTNEGSASAASKPALFVVAGFGSGAVHTTENALFALRAWARTSTEDEHMASLLRRVTLFVAPCADPDGRERLLAEDAAASPVAFDRNFPVGWHPWAAGGGAGAYPLSQPEVRAVAEFLDRHRNISLVQVLGSDVDPVMATFAAGGTLAGTTSVPTPLAVPDLDIYRRLDGLSDGDVVAGYRPHDEATLFHRGGGLLEFAHRKLGAYGVISSFVDRLPQDGFELPDLGKRTRDAIRFLARQLPYLVLDDPVVEKLRGGLWQIDVALRNVGTLPTLSHEGRKSFACAPVSLRVEGLEVVAAAVKERSDEVFRVVGPDPGNLALGQFEGDETRWVRFIARAPAPQPAEAAEGQDPEAGTPEGTDDSAATDASSPDATDARPEEAQAAPPVPTLILESKRAGSAVVPLLLRDD